MNNFGSFFLLSFIFPAFFLPFSTFLFSLSVFYLSLFFFLPSQQTINIIVQFIHSFKKLDYNDIFHVGIIIQLNPGGLIYRLEKNEVINNSQYKPDNKENRVLPGPLRSRPLHRRPGIGVRLQVNQKKKDRVGYFF